MKKPCKHKFVTDYDAVCYCTKCFQNEDAAAYLDLLQRLKDVADYTRVWEHGYADLRSAIEEAIQDADSKR